MSKFTAIPDLSRLQPLSGSNYRRWAEELSFLFQEIGVDYVLEDENTSSSATESSGPEGLTSVKKKREGSFEEHNRTCRGHILKHLSEKLFDIYVKFGSAKEIWKNLKKKYGGEDEGKKQYITSQWTRFMIKEDVPILEQIHDYEVIVSKIQAEGMPIDDYLAALVLIDKLPQSWNSYRSKLKHEKKKMSLDELIADIMIEDANRIYLDNNDKSEERSYNANLVEKSGDKDQVKKDHKKKSKTSANQSTEFKKKIRCWNCNKKGHRKFECKLPLKQKETPKVHITENLIAVVVEANTVSNKVEWIIDSGATRHICNDKSLFQKIEEISDKVYLGDARGLNVSGIGEVNIKLSSGRTLTLTQVLFVSSMKRNLISSGLLMAAGIKQTIESGKLVLSKNGDYVGKAFCTGNLFVLESMNENGGSVYMACNLSSWHKRLGHVNLKSIKKLHSLKLIPDKLDNELTKCEICSEAKHFRRPFPNQISRTSEVLDLIHSDLADFKNKESRGGKRYYVTFIDDYSRYCQVYLLKSKDETLDMFIRFKAEVENQQSKKIKRLRSDRGGEYESNSFKILCEKEGIIHEKSAPYSPQQNGISERKNRTLKDMMNAMLISSGLPDSMWGEAILSANYILNKIPHRKLDKTPYELWKGFRPNLSYLRVWGCLVKVGLPDFKKSTIGAKTVDAIFVGYALNSAAYRCMIFDKSTKVMGNVIESRDVEFFEDIFPFKNHEQRLEHQEKRVRELVTDKEEVEIRKSKRMKTATNFGPDFITSFIVEQNELSEDFVVTFLIEDEPANYEEAMKSIDAVFWKEAINSEFDSIISNHTWELTDLPTGCKAMKCKWILKKKLKADGSIDKFKARLVAQGFTQKQGLDYFDTYAPVSKIASIRILFAFASSCNLLIHQMDVKTAFLNGEIAEEIYLQQPEGFTVEGQEDKVCKLKKSLYGLKQAPKQWYEKFSSTLKEAGFTQNNGDVCLFSRMNNGEYVIICLYVDDILILGKDIEMILETKRFLESKFSMKDMNEVDVILGIKVTRTEDGYSLNQSHYIEKILEKFQYSNSGKACSPYDASVHLCKNRGEGVRQGEYAKVLGSVMYLMNCTRPDIAYAVSRLSRYTQNPSREHWKAINRLIKYLKGTKDWKLNFKRSPCILEAYCDANWISDNDEVNSTSGMVFMLAGGAVSWKSCKQSCIARSTMESELIAMELAAQEADWLRSVIMDLPMTEKSFSSVSLRCDCQAAIAVASNKLYNGKKRHIRMRHKVIRGFIETGVLSLEYVRSAKNLADPLTKALCGHKVLDTAKEMGLS